MTDETRGTDRAERRERPTARQVLHAATGDRDAEAAALADQAGDVSEEDAMIAVQRAHGEAGIAAPTTATDLAEPRDAVQVRDERRNEQPG